ncbi:MAG: cobalamin biosynthesis protein, partial [Candidatus Bathyarchaeota archaeon]|nr:cobalamin biosynthesis protein [Candidatus Bathyarchaeota archaeon]
MFAFDLTWLIDSIFIFTLAFLIDLILGEYPDRIHPTIGIGKIINYLRKKAKNPNPKIEKANGVLMVIAIILVIALPIGVFLVLLRLWAGPIPYIIVGAILFKATFAIRGMGQYTIPISAALQRNDLDDARKWLPYIVRRDPKSLNKKQITSAAVESIAESTTDG